MQEYLIMKNETTKLKLLQFIIERKNKAKKMNQNGKKKKNKTRRETNFSTSPGARDKDLIDDARRLMVDVGR